MNTTEITLWGGERRFSVAPRSGNPVVLHISDGTTDLHVYLSPAQLRELRDVIDAALEGLS